jgi:hypothetical protein
MFKIHKQEVLPGIFCLRFRDQYEAASTFLRLQEFYESPFREIRDHVFSLEEYMDRYARETGNFTYTCDWEGFNVPGDVVRRFFKAFARAGEPLLKKEELLRAVLQEQLQGTRKFYVIGHCEKKELPDWTKARDRSSTLAHEIAHGLFYLNPAYHKAATTLLKGLPSKVVKKMSGRLLNSGGHCKAVLPDEFQAYLATSRKKDLKDIFGINLARQRKEFKELFLKTVRNSAHA